MTVAVDQVTHYRTVVPHGAEFQTGRITTVVLRRGGVEIQQPTVIVMDVKFTHVSRDMR